MSSAGRTWRFVSDPGSAGTPVPNFFLVGVFKAGTTSLYNYLRQHPDVYLSPKKEPNFFVPEFRIQNLDPNWQRLMLRDQQAFRQFLDQPYWGRQPRGFVTNWEDYLKLFRAASGQQAIGEGSVGCLWSPTAAQAISERFPGARVLMILRNPVDRAFSQYRFMSRAERGESFGGVVRRAANSDEEPPFSELNPFLGLGLYFAQVRRFLSHFPRDRVGIWLFDDLVRDPDSLLREVFRFLGLRDDVPLDVTRRHNETRPVRFPRLERAVIDPLARRYYRFAPPVVRRMARTARFGRRQAAAMSSVDRRFLTEYYAEDVQRLARLIGRDLCGWLET